jgi:hypothetical protein
MIRDFMGNELSVGDFVVAGGSGNSKAEYGMILYRVEDTSGKLKLRRLTVSYPTANASNTVVESRLITVENTNRYARIFPAEHVIDLFARAVNGTLTQNERTLVGKWIHGANEGALAIFQQREHK